MAAGSACGSACLASSMVANTWLSFRNACQWVVSSLSNSVSQSNDFCHSYCINSFAAVVMGHSNPNGSNTLANSEHTTRFVTVPCSYGVARPSSLSSLGFHTIPSVFIVASENSLKSRSSPGRPLEYPWVSRGDLRSLEGTRLIILQYFA